MDSIGAEVGQKMRSAIKAKLMELDCYVDDELPDYIMVMVANRRSKSQMSEDLNLFLATKTTTFVNWLHIVLKKLKEVTVTNPEVYKKAIKRQSSEQVADDNSSPKVKKEKAHKKVKKESQADRSESQLQESMNDSSSITDDLPISANKLSDNRKIIITNSKTNSLDENITDDNFDIPLLSEVSDSANERELQDIERKIRNVKSRLGLLVQSDNEEDSTEVKSENDMSSEQTQSKDGRNSISSSRHISYVDDQNAESEHKSTSESNGTLNNLFQNREVELEKDIVDSPTNAFITTEKEEKKLQHKRITFDNDSEPVPIKARLDRVAGRGSSDRFRDRSEDGSPAKTPQGKKPSILDRLGEKIGSPDRLGRSDTSGFRNSEFRRRSSSRDRDRSSRLSDRLGDRKKRDFSRERRRSRSRDRSPLRSKDRTKEKEARKDRIRSRLGVQSKVAVVKKQATIQKSEDEEEIVIREVQSAIKVKPRVIPSDAVQPNKNLLLKAVAEAQRSIAQTPKVGKEVEHPDGLFTKKYSEKRANSSEYREEPPRKLLEQGKNKLKDIIRQSSSRMRSRHRHSSDDYESENEYTPKPVRRIESDVPHYIPSSKSGSETESKENDNATKENGKQQFIITLDGIEQMAFMKNRESVKSRLDESVKKRSPSPIVFDKTKNKPETRGSRPDIPDTLPMVHPPLSVKNKERCRYWPGCRQGDKCEFVHPTESCAMFPQCKFGEKCLFLHPKCKFGSTCTKRDCPYDHSGTSKISISSKLSPLALSTMQNCKFFPNCTNLNCPFYHPKPCKYGKYCKNISECNFSHALVASKRNLSWRSK